MKDDKWEKVDGNTWKLRVPGGWLVWSNYVNDVSPPVFVPDQSGAWETA